MFILRRGVAYKKPRKIFWALFGLTLLLLPLYIVAFNQLFIANFVHTYAATNSAIPHTALAQTNAQLQNCNPVKFGKPGDISARDASTGLTAQNDTPTYYRIFGFNMTQLRSQIEQCAPNTSGAASAEFSAYTSYNLMWNYAFSYTGSSCTVTTVHVAIHTTMALPLWVPHTGAAAGLPARWQLFTAHLRTHEQGHVTIDNRYATQLMHDLQDIGTTSCDELSGTVSGLASNDITALDQANAAYDAQTNHGATQGAVLPTN